TMKCKGIPQKELKELDYIHHGRPIAFFGMKKKITKLTKEDREKGITPFSVCNNWQVREFMKNQNGLICSFRIISSFRKDMKVMIMILIR
ncbi:MAG: hypothetical protein P4M14_09925, partial [Gammaproteobacteria bacterium]|nr:hypothetical protein [Gammaproteobacteria bacterium]